MWAPSVFLCVLVFQEALMAEEHLPCTTPAPELENGVCVTITECPELDNAFRNGNRSQFILNSVCTGDGLPHVCCKLSEYRPAFNPYSILTTSKPTAEINPEISLEFLDGNVDNNGRVICGPVKSFHEMNSGNETKMGEFPWMAALTYQSKCSSAYQGIKCGGSLITSRYVISAAHCLSNNESVLVGVLLGEWKLSTDPDCSKSKAECAPDVQNLKIKREIRHELYNKLRKENDIGLIELEKSVVFTDFVRPICLPPKDLPPVIIGDSMTVSGWEATKNSLPSDIMLKRRAFLLEDYHCRKFSNKRITLKHLCVGHASSDACKGDPGEPIMRRYRHSKGLHWFLEGLVGFDVECRLSATGITVYTRVPIYIDWIVRMISYPTVSIPATDVPPTTPEDTPRPTNIFNLINWITRGYNAVRNFFG